jgi:bacterioferritin-associated ferredoxin
MIVCSCTRVTDTDIHQAIAWMRAADPYTLITPGKIYRALGKSAQCGGCIRLFVEKMRTDGNLAVPAELRSLRARPREDEARASQE